MKKVNDGFSVEVLCKYKVPLIFCYKVRLVNDTNNTVTYDMSKLKSPHGDNVLNIDPVFNHDSVGLLISGEIEAGQSVEGLIALQRNMTATMTPRIFYEDTIIIG